MFFLKMALFLLLNLVSYVSAQTSLPDFCGISTNRPCQINADCQAGGCSGQVCEGKGENTITTCEYRDCYDARRFGVSCGCIQGRCRWSTPISTPTSSVTPSPVCGNHICEKEEGNICPPCVSQIPSCLAPCYAGTCPEDCQADLNEDGRIDVTDLGILLSHWGPLINSGQVDLYQDGKVDVVDLGILLSSWAPI